MKILLLVFVCYQSMALAKETVDLSDQPGQCPTDIKPYTEYDPNELNGQWNIMAMMTKKRPQEMRTAIESKEVESLMTGKENQSAISYVKSTTPGLFSVKMVNDAGETVVYNGSLLGLFKIEDNPIGFGYFCRNKDSATREESIIIWNRENAIVDTTVMEEFEKIKSRYPELNEKLDSFQNNIMDLTPANPKPNRFFFGWGETTTITTTTTTTEETTTFKNTQNESSHMDEENKSLNYIIELTFWIYNSFSWTLVIEFILLSVILIILVVLILRSKHCQMNRCVRIKKSYIVAHEAADGEFKEVNLQE